MGARHKGESDREPRPRALAVKCAMIYATSISVRYEICHSAGAISRPRIYNVYVLNLNNTYYNHYCQLTKAGNGISSYMHFVFILIIFISINRK